MKTQWVWGSERPLLSSQERKGSLHSLPPPRFPLSLHCPQPSTTQASAPSDPKNFCIYRLALAVQVYDLL